MINPVKSGVMVVGEMDYWGIQFSGSDIAGGVTIDSATVAVSPGVGLGTGLVLNSATAILTTDLTACYAWVDAVTSGTYDLTFTVTFSDGKILVRVFEIKVF